MTGRRNPPIRVLVADDQAIVRDGLVLLLSAADDLEVVAIAADGRQAVELALRHQPTVAMLDLRMPALDGAEVTAELARLAPTIRVLILTTFADDDAVLPALRAGAAGYLTKDATGETLLGAIRDVAAGRMVLDPAVQLRLVQLLREGPPPADTAAANQPADPGAAAGLTRREVDVARLIAQGLTNREIARSLVLSEATVKTHINHVLAKLALNDRSALVAWAWRQGLIDGRD